VADDVDATVVHVVAGFDLVDDAADVAGVVDARLVEIAARAGCVPIAVAVALGLPLAIGRDGQEAVLIGQRADSPTAVVLNKPDGSYRAFCAQNESKRGYAARS
jgi:hypothetical protein